MEKDILLKTLEQEKLFNLSGGMSNPMNNQAEYEGHNPDCYCKTRQSQLNWPTIEINNKGFLKPGQLKNERIIKIFENNQMGLENLIDEISPDGAKPMKTKEFKFEIMICFWFALHLENVELCKFLFN